MIRFFRGRDEDLHSDCIRLEPGQRELMMNYLNDSVKFKEVTAFHDQIFKELMTIHETVLHDLIELAPEAEQLELAVLNYQSFLEGLNDRAAAV